MSDVTAWYINAAHDRLGRSDKPGVEIPVGHRLHHDLIDAGVEVAAYQPPAPTAADVKAEAARRILAIIPEWKQRNLTARAAELAKKGEADWTQAEADEWAAGQALWDQVKAIRAKSDAIEALDPIPADFADDSHWPSE